MEEVLLGVERSFFDSTGITRGATSEEAASPQAQAGMPDSVPSTPAGGARTRITYRCNYPVGASPQAQAFAPGSVPSATLPAGRVGTGITQRAPSEEAASPAQSRAPDSLPLSTLPAGGVRTGITRRATFEEPASPAQASASDTVPSSTDDKDDVKDQHGVPIEPQKEEAALRGSAAALEFDIKTTSNIKAALGKSVEKVQLDLEARTMSYGVPGVPSKIVHCHKISQMTRGGRSADNLRQVNFVITQDDWRTEKEWLFGSTADSTRFVRFIQAVNACGQQIRDAFNELDVRGTGHIGAEDLQHFSRDLPRETLERMIASASHANLSTGVNFRDFFELFMESPIFYIYSVDQAINVWHLLVREGDSITEAPGTPESRKMTWTALKRAVSAPTLRSQAQTKPSLVPGERLMNMVEKVRYYIINEQKYHKTQQPSTSGTHPIQGALFLTSFRLVLRSYRSHYGSGSDECGRPRQPNEMPDAFTQIDLPVAAISRIELARETNRAVIIWCKDLRVLHITFSGNDLFVANLVDFVCDLAFPDGGSTSTFELARHLNGAFASKFTTPTSMSEAKGQAFGLSPHASVGERNGWALYNLRSEFERQGVLPSARWRLYGDNYQLVDTYPLEFVLPAAFTESEIQVAAKFRTRKRLPALTWRDSSSGACLVRSSQPYVGVGAHRCPEDEKLLNILRCHGDPSSATEQKMPSDFYIVDARGRAAAIGNKARGKGVENVNNYACTKLHFCDIGNIHTMRASLKELASIVLPSGDGADSENWLSNLENTKWLSHIRSLLKGAVFIAEKLRMEGASVLVHCSDGWDRTAQLSATAQILLDPYFRSIKGFAVLVEKDWCAFGHKFKDRCGHASRKHDDQERSPVFLQWLDVVWQLMRQFPNAFEFTEKLLLFLADALFSCQFGTFLGNCESERSDQGLNIRARTESVWTCVLTNTERFRNQSYSAAVVTLWPCTSIKKLALWERYFCRWDPEMHPLSGEPWKDTWAWASFDSDAAATL